MLEFVTASDIVRSSLVTMWSNVLGYFPQIFAAIIVFLIGWLIAVVLAKFAWYIVKTIQLDKALESLGFKKVVERAGYSLNSAFFFYELVKWFFLIVFLMAATNILGLSQVTDFLSRIVLYLPNVFVAAFILVIGIIVARFLEGLVRGSIKAAHLTSGHLIGMATRWIVLIFSALVALSQLGVAEEIIRIVITGVVAAITIALGLSFGLGGKSHADDFISGVRKRIKE